MKKCRSCGAPFTPEGKGQGPRTKCYACLPVPTGKKCRGCSAWALWGNTYCGACRLANKKQRALAEVELKKAQVRARPRVPCVICGSLCLPMKLRKYCSLACERAGNYRNRGKRGPGTISPCAECKKPFPQPATRKGGWYIYCEGCRPYVRNARSMAKGKVRKERLKSRPQDQIRRDAVFERDGWRCQICGAATPAGLKGSTSPMAPQMDHVIAIAAGGTHTWGNVQCACRRCNARKGAGAAVRPAVYYLGHTA